MRNRPRPSLNLSNDGGVALKVLLLKLPINIVTRPVGSNYLLTRWEKVRYVLPLLWTLARGRLFKRSLDNVYESHRVTHV